MTAGQRGGFSSEAENVVCSVSVKTVEFHRSCLMTKLGVRTVAELTWFA